MVSASASLLEPTISFLRHPPPPLTPLRNRPLTCNPSFLVSQSHLSPNNPHSPPIPKSLRFSPHSAFTSPPPSIVPAAAAASAKEEEEETTTSLLDAAVDALRQFFGGLQKPAVAAVLIGVLLATDPFSAALAAGGGRMGGRAFSSRSQSPSSSRSYTAPSRGSSSGFSYSTPYYAPTPFGGGGFFMGPAVGMGFGAGSGFFLMMGFAAVLLLSGFLSDRGDDGSVLTATQKISIIKLQVGLLGMARSFQKDLDRIAEAADTSTSEGLTYVLTETALALLRHPDCCISAYSAVDIKRSSEDGEKRFNQLSIEERGKFDEETLVNVNSIKRQNSTSQTYKGFSNEYIVVTILVAAEGTYKLPVINSSADLKEALQKIASIPSHKVQGVEVLWTPQNESDILTERELLEDYPLLRPL